MSSSTTSVRRPFCWRISRYDPEQRDSRGAYPADDWTSLADVGEAFGGRVLTLNEYQRVEDLYVTAAISFAREADVGSLEITHVEKGSDVSCSAAKWPVSDESLLREMLREEVICRLEAADGRFQLDIGTDLYLFIESSTDCPAAVRETEARGLFVEPGLRSEYWSEG